MPSSPETPYETFFRVRRELELAGADPLEASRQAVGAAVEAARALPVPVLALLVIGGIWLWQNRR